MGLARAAELNGYPGPAHVLELAPQLGLTADQTIRTEALFLDMQARAIRLGKELIEEERALDTLFASNAATSEAVSASVSRIGSLYAQLRQVHLDAHLAQKKLLTPEQVARYNHLRGYAAEHEHAQRQKHH